jgi:hypothetical protein
LRVFRTRKHLKFGAFHPKAELVSDLTGLIGDINLI